MRLQSIIVLLILLFMAGCKPPVEIKEVGPKLEPITFVPGLSILRDQMNRTLSLSWDTASSNLNDNLFNSLSIFNGDEEVLKIDDFKILQNTNSYQIDNISSGDIDLRVVETVRNFNEFVSTPVFDKKIGTVLAAENVVASVSNDNDLTASIDASFSFTWDSVTKDSTNSPVIQDEIAFNQYDAVNALLKTTSVPFSSSYMLEEKITDNNPYSFGLNASYSSPDKKIRWRTGETTRVSVRVINVINGLIVPASAQIERQDTFNLGAAPTSSSNLTISWDYSVGTAGTVGAGNSPDGDMVAEIFEQGSTTPVWAHTYPASGVTAGNTVTETPTSIAFDATKNYYFSVRSDTVNVKSFLTIGLPTTLLDTANSVGIVMYPYTYQYFDGLPQTLPPYSDNGVTIAPSNIDVTMSNGTKTTPNFPIYVSQGRTQNIYAEQTPLSTSLPTGAYSQYRLAYSFGSDHDHTITYEKPTEWIISNLTVNTPSFDNVAAEVSISIDAANASASASTMRLGVEGVVGFRDILTIPTGTGISTLNQNIPYSVFLAGSDTVDWSLKFYYDRPNYPSFIFHQAPIDNFVEEALDIDFVSLANASYALKKLPATPDIDFNITRLNDTASLTNINYSTGLKQLGLKPIVKSAGTGITATNLIPRGLSIPDGSIFILTKTHKDGTTSTLQYNLSGAITINSPPSSPLKYQNSYKFGDGSASTTNAGVPVDYGNRLSLIAAGNKAAYAMYATPVPGQKHSFLSWGDLNERAGLGPSIETFDVTGSRSIIENTSGPQDVKTIYAGRNWVAHVLLASAFTNSYNPYFVTSYTTGSTRRTDNTDLDSFLFSSQTYPIGISSGNAPYRFLATSGNEYSYAIAENNNKQVFNGSARYYAGLPTAYGTRITSGGATLTEKKDVAVNLNTSAFITKGSSGGIADGALFIRGQDSKVFGDNSVKAFNATGSGSSSNYVGIVGSNTYYAVLDSTNKVKRIGDGLGMTSPALWTSPALISLSIRSLNVVDMAAGVDHLLILLSDGSLYTVGLNDKGQLGDGTNIARTHFVRILNGVTVIDIAAGDKFSMALDSSANLYVWGDNSSGQLGVDKNNLTETSTPISFY